MRSIRILSTLCLATLVAVPLLAKAEDEGAKIFAKSCSGCHNPGRLPLDKTYMTREKWKEDVDRMIDGDRLEARLKKEDYATLLDFLAAHQGPANAPPAAAGGSDKK